MQEGNGKSEIKRNFRVREAMQGAFQGRHVTQRHINQCDQTRQRNKGAHLFRQLSVPERIP